MAGTDTISSGYPSGGMYSNPRRGRGQKPVLEKTKSVGYTSGAVSDNIFTISKSISATGAE